ncbi:MAG: hypothetical protein PF637_01385 [Spirochaetes bacterium]|jgi:hypothetical protein|nr:hypothetical protein [Spirochaetota bacterium]
MLNFLMRCRTCVFLTFSIVLIMSCLSCDIEEDAVDAFYGTDSIGISSPEKEADVSGDILFAFSEFYSNYVNVAIFAKQPSISSDNQISNWSDCVGGIRSNMPGFVRGEVYLSDMRPFSMDDMDFTGENPLELEVGKKYYWVVWGLNSKLTYIEESSASYSFTYVEATLETIVLDSPGHWDEVSGNVKFNYSGYESNFRTVAIFSDLPSQQKDGDSVVISMDNCIGGHNYSMAHYNPGYVYLYDMYAYSSINEGFTSQELLLTPGVTYFWMVWGLDGAKTKIIELSSVRKFVYTE